MAVLVLVFVLTASGIALAKLGGGDIIFSVTGAANVLFSHDNHAGSRKIGCSECHYAVFNRSHAGHQPVAMADMQKGKSCGTCHNARRAFSVSDPQSCAKCHNQ
jgi:c(7)-type cytochrome triheme protein